MSSNRFAARDTDAALLETAAEWRVRLTAEDGVLDPRVAQAFGEWLTADPAHAEAFDRTTVAWSLFEPHSAAPEVIRARRDALDFVRRSGGPGRRGVLRIAASIAVAAVLGAAVWPFVDGVDVYRTGLGERRLVTLDDGSTVWLDSQSRLSVRYTEDARRLALAKGQARFDVAHNPYRPFSVRAGDRSVVATGTAFNIDIVGRDVQVTLLEGSVIVAPVAEDKSAIAPTEARPLPRPVQLRSGQRLVAASGSPMARVEAVNLEDATAWQRGKLIFDDVPLSEAVARVNRYSERRIVIRDPAVARLQVSGVFESGDPAAFARAMSQYLDIDAAFTSGEIVLGPAAKG